MLAEEKHDILWKANLMGALGNVALNYLLIPAAGAMGAALASLLTQIFTNVLLGFVMRQLRENNRMMIRGLNPVPLLREIRKLRE